MFYLKSIIAYNFHLINNLFFSDFDSSFRAELYKRLSHLLIYYFQYFLSLEKLLIIFSLLFKLILIYTDMAYCTIILVILLILHSLSFHGSHSLEITLVQTLNSRHHEEFEYGLLSTCPFKTLDLTFQAPRYT